MRFVSAMKLHFSRIAMLVACHACIPALPSPVNDIIDGEKDAQSDTEPGPIPFVQDGVGAAWRDHAGDFIAEPGRWHFSRVFDGRFNVLVIASEGHDRVGSVLWSMPLVDILSALPKNTHLIFASNDLDAAEKAETKQQELFSWLEKLTPEDARDVFSRIHVIDAKSTTKDDWMGSVVYAHGPGVFMISRAQELRSVANVMTSSGPDLAALARELVALNREAEDQQALRNLDAFSVDVFKMHPHLGGWGDGANSFAEIILPSNEVLEHANRVHVELLLACEGRDEGTCPAWDRTVQLFVCDPLEPNTCEHEIARWISPYHREGWWLTDISSMLPLMHSGGPVRFRLLHHNGQPISVRLHFSNDGSSKRPIGIQKLWRGGVFNADYNQGREAIALKAPEGATSAQLAVLVTGHGFGKDTLNCAEFCNHTHYFGMGTSTWGKRHPEAGSSDGCLIRVAEGVVPNQWGTWYYGRGGWCPGQDVGWWTVDVPMVGEMTYEGGVNDQAYVPVLNNNVAPNAFDSNIEMTSYIVYYEGKWSF